MSITGRPISVKLDSKHPWPKGIQNCTNKMTGLLCRGDYNKSAKMGVIDKKNHFENH
jgi:hypothetical protein